GVRLVAVSKTKPVEDLQQAYMAGMRIFGENKAIEMQEKQQALPKDIAWHFIGHLQTNKVKYIAPFVSLIHSVDRLDLLEVINKEAQKNRRIIPCLLQFHIAQEDTKFGLNLSSVKELLESEAYKKMENVRIDGVMGMATNTDDRVQIRTEFAELKKIYSYLQQTFFKEQASFKEISMGMSDDYILAMEEGATLVRVGSAIFGARNYEKKSL
ncbi:MAG: YggS family pyridoxal phosphate-dependent enzyme, partial [Bacteroidales bacterium]